MKTYRVLRQQHDGAKDYTRGDAREMTEADAAPLVQMGALEEVKAKPAAKKAAT